MRGTNRELQLSHDLAQSLQGLFGFALPAQDHCEVLGMAPKTKAATAIAKKVVRIISSFFYFAYVCFYFVFLLFCSPWKFIRWPSAPSRRSSVCLLRRLWIDQWSARAVWSTRLRIWGSGVQISSGALILSKTYVNFASLNAEPYIQWGARLGAHNERLAPASPHYYRAFARQR
jgi:hypothetical protein